MDDAAPACRYYVSLVGSWEGRFEVRITSATELARLPLASRLTGRAAQHASPMWMRTTLEGEGRTFRHTTRVSAWGVDAYTTDEIIELDDDGRRLRMSG